MKKQLVTAFVASAILAACGQSTPPNSSSSVAATQAAARLRSYCEQNRADCWFGAQNQARVAQERAQRMAPETNLASREPIPTARSAGIVQPPECDDLSAAASGRAAANCPLTAARVAVLSRPASDTHRVLLAQRQVDRPTTLNFGNPRPEPRFKWFAQYFAQDSSRTAAAEESPTATQLSMDTRRSDRGYQLRFLGPTAGAER